MGPDTLPQRDLTKLDIYYKLCLPYLPVYVDLKGLRGPYISGHHFVNSLNIQLYADSDNK